EASVAVGLQGTHAQLLSQGEGLVIVGCGLLGLRRITTCGALAEEPVGMRLVAASCLGAVEFKEASSDYARLLHAADEEQGLTQFGEHERLVDHTASGGHAL